MRAKFTLTRLIYLLITWFLLASNAGAALVARSLDANPQDIEAYYDTDLNVTWLRNANLALTEFFGQVSISAQTGQMNAFTAAGWISDMNAGTQGYLDVTGWRLPSMDVDGNGTIVDCATATASDCLDNEYGHLFWVTGITAANPGPFDNLRAGEYWSGTEAGEDFAWVLDFGGNRGQAEDDKFFLRNVWPLLDGDVGVAVIPVPAGIWLLGSALTALGLVRRRFVNQAAGGR